MKDIKCKCGRTIPKEEHTGMCQLDHFISYTGNGKHGVDSNELRRIVGVFAQEKINNISLLALGHLINVASDRKTHGEISETTYDEVLDFVNDISESFKRIKKQSVKNGHP